ncbi:hypothetical protein JCM8097_007151 [Rhodosporidiobolus ruineniae]
MSSPAAFAQQFWAACMAGQYDALAAHFAEDATVETQPPNAFSFIPNLAEGAVKAQDKLAWWKSVKEAVVKEDKGLELHQSVSTGNTVVTRCTGHVICPDGKPYAHNFVMFIEFDDAGKVKRAVEFVDTVAVAELFKRAGLSPTTAKKSTVQAVKEACEVA